MNLSKILQEAKLGRGSCYSECMVLLNNLPANATIKKVPNKGDPWSEKPGFYIEHLRMSYKIHFVVQIEDKVLDTFLREMGPIPVDEYLSKVYKNHKDLQMV